LIDHITLSNELADLYIDQSARVHYEFSLVITQNSFRSLPVSVRLQLKLMTVDALTSTDVSCNGEANGTATVSVSGGITPYTYQWSTGSTTRYK
jgi:hypothetical protein